MALTTGSGDLKTRAPDFTLPGVDGRDWSLAEVAGKNGTVVAFICNHCPYVVAVIDRIVADAATLAAEGIGFVAISANDPVAYPQDSFPRMKDFASRHGFGFPYLFDGSQEIARAYDAACTPDIYGLSAEGMILYRGRLDEGRMQPPPPGAKRELVEAMRLIAETGQGPYVQHPSMGCSIKWR